MDSTTGTVIFACHKVFDSVAETGAATSYPQHSNGYANDQSAYMYSHPQQQVGRAYNANGESSVYGMSYMDEGMGQQMNAQSYVQRWVEGQSQESTNMLPGAPDEQWAPTESTMSSPIISANGRAMDADAGAGAYYTPYLPHQSLPHQPQPPSQWSVTPSYPLQHGEPHRGQSPGYSGTPYAQSASLAASSQEHSPAGAPPPKLPSQSYPYCPTPGSNSGSGPRRTDDDDDAPYPTAGRSSVESTGFSGAGGLRCASCGVTHSPEWRKGPSGKKDLCNA